MQLRRRRTAPDREAEAFAAEDEVMQRAMADPAVQSFREAFPDAKCGRCAI